MLIYGKNPIKDLFDQNPKKLKKVYISKKRHQQFYRELEDANIKLFPLEDINVNKLFGSYENIQGIIAEIDEPQLISLSELIDINSKKNNSIILMLDKINDPQNFGAILRSAAAFEVDGVIISKRGNSPLTSTVMKASAGNWNKINICETSSLNQAIILLKKSNYWIASTSLEGNSSLNDLKSFNKPLVIIVGNEGKGVRKSLQDNSDLKIKISISSKVESLNVSTATAIILHTIYEENNVNKKSTGTYFQNSKRKL